MMLSRIMPGRFNFNSRMFECVGAITSKKS